MQQVEEPKDLVWLPKNLALKVREITDVKAIEAEILKYVQETHNSLKLDTEAMDEQIIQYRANMIKCREAFKKAKDEELDAFLSLWEKYDEDLKNVRGYVSEAQKVLKPLVEELQSVKKEITQIDTWGFERLGEAIQKLTGLYGDNREMFEFLVKNYKKEEKI